MRTSEMELQRATKDNLLMRQTISELNLKLKGLDNQIKAQEAQSSQLKKALNEKERGLTKMQTSLLIKDKLLN